MKKIIFIILSVLFFYMLEFLFFNIVNERFVPNFLLLFIVFVTLWLGVRYGIFSAAFAGILKDSFSVNIFGANLISYILCAYLIVFLKRYIYKTGSRFSRMILISIILIINFFIKLFFLSINQHFNYLQKLHYIFLPEFICTIIVSTFVFYELKKCALKLSV